MVDDVKLTSLVARLDARAARCRAENQKTLGPLLADAAATLRALSARVTEERRIADDLALSVSEWRATAASLDAQVAALRGALGRIAAPMPGLKWAATERQEIARAALLNDGGSDAGA